MARQTATAVSSAKASTAAWAKGLPGAEVHRSNQASVHTRVVVATAAEAAPAFDDAGLRHGTMSRPVSRTSGQLAP